MLLDKIMQEKDELWGLNSLFKHPINDLRVSLCAPKETPIFCSAEMKLLKIKCRTILWFWWLSDNPSWTQSLSGCLLLKWGHWLGKNGILQTETGTCRKTLMKPGTLKLNSDESLPGEVVSPPSVESAFSPIIVLSFPLQSALPEETVMASLRKFPCKLMLNIPMTHPITPLCF